MLRGPRPDWARWAARLAHAFFCALGGLFFWFLLGGVAQADPAPAPSLTDSLGSIVDSVVDEVTTPPSTGIEPVDTLTSTVAGLLHNTQRSLPPPLTAARREVPPAAAPEELPAPVAAAPAPVVTAPAPAAIRTFTVDAAKAETPATAAVSLASAPAEHRVAPGVPAAPPPQTPSAASSAGAQSAYMQPSGAPSPEAQRVARLLPRDEVFTAIRVTRPEVSPD